ncbi:XdhC family protein [Aeromicrobium stalagmiti]|uniref:XdhC family protein n=1 Tax=Aeromicrobium stalagmiti TaxID=2738988 RepID=UPI00156828BE|nr:XdhC family protein [Aeromicrobium stalagmiti]
MRDVIPALMGAWHDGRTVGLATVVGTQKSAPRRPGAAMVVMPDGAVLGSVSGGCVEGAVYELATDVVADGRAALQQYGYSDDEAFAVGLTCGGIIDIFVEPVSAATFPELEKVAVDVAEGRPVAVATVVEHPDPSWVGRHLVVRPDSTEGSIGSERVDDTLTDDVRGLLAAGTSTLLTYGAEGQRMDVGMRVFVSSFQPPPRMIVFGAIDFASAVSRQGALLGYEVTVCDARPVFATAARFPDADEVVVDWPHRYLAAQVDAGLVDRRTTICVLTHDPKFDVPVLEVALRLTGDLQPAFVGAMGSRTTHDDRMARLRDVGLTEDQLALLSSPIGLDLGGRTPEETAVSIAAEIVARRWGGTGAPLTRTQRRVHHTGPA